MNKRFLVNFHVFRMVWIITIVFIIVVKINVICLHKHDVFTYAGPRGVCACVSSLAAQYKRAVLRSYTVLRGIDRELRWTHH